MTTLQECLNQEYPTQADKEKVKEVELNKILCQRGDNVITRKLEGGELDLTEYPNLMIVSIDGRYLESRLTKLDVSNCHNLKALICQNNLLTELDLSKNRELIILCINNNNLPEQDLSILSRLVKLKYLSLGNNDQERINQNIYNHFTGSLEPLKNMAGLEYLEISNTGINSGLEHLSSSVKKIHCSYKERPESKVQNITKELDSEPNLFFFCSNGKYSKSQAQK
jgi:Leucine-rich repeat (LRR) protein